MSNQGLCIYMAAHLYVCTRGLRKDYSNECVLMPEQISALGSIDIKALYKKPTFIPSFIHQCVLLFASVGSTNMPGPRSL